jgi:hypothetical protein
MTNYSMQTGLVGHAPSDDGTQYFVLVKIAAF